MRASLGVLIISTALVTLPGCAGTHGVRYVYQDGAFGVLGIPENTDRWPTHYRRKAEALMDGHFPDGHDKRRAWRPALLREEILAVLRGRMTVGEIQSAADRVLRLAA